MVSYIKSFFRKLTNPTSQNEDKARREFILNVLLLAIIGLSFIAFAINFIKSLMGIPVAISATIMFVPVLFFVGLYFMSRRGLTTLTSIIFLGLFFLLNSYMAIAYGIDIPSGLLVYTLVIIMSGILIGTRFSFFATFVVAAFVITVGYLQINSILPPQLYWRTEMLNKADVIIFSIIFSIIMIISWLSNREIEKSLARARKSEAELKKERDMLEITVESRTKELKEAQAEKMGQLYRFAEFGRISSGLFHDLINPLNAVSLNIEKVKSSNEDVLSQVRHIEGQTGIIPIGDASQYVDRAISAAKKLENLVASVRKQLVRQENKAVFSLNEEIEHVIDVLSHKAEKAHVAIRLSSKDDVKIFGDAIRFNQIVLNLIANAIDAYLPDSKNERTVKISLNNAHHKIILKVTDYGTGIPEENISKIFEPFFTTKEEGLGIGLGLSMTKRIVEKDFGGAISVSSKIGDGTMFTVELPDRNE